MKCRNCGKELKEIGILNEDELRDYIRISEMYNNATQALKPEVVNGFNFTEGQVFEYFRAGFDEMAKASFLSFCLMKDLRNKYKFTTECYVDQDTGKLYVH